MRTCKKKPIRTLFYPILRVNVTEKPKLRYFLKPLVIKRTSIRTRQPRRKQSIR